MQEGGKKKKEMLKVEGFFVPAALSILDTLKTCLSAGSIRMLKIAFLANACICSSAFKIAYGGY